MISILVVVSYQELKGRVWSRKVINQIINKSILNSLEKKKTNFQRCLVWQKSVKNEKNLKIHSSILIGYRFYDVPLGFDRNAFQYAAAAVV